MASRRSKRIPKSRLGEYRRQALEMHSRGFPARQIARVLGCGRSTVFGWVRQAGEGWEIDPVSPPGRAPRLSDAQVAQLYALVFTNPQQLGFDFGLWTRTMVAELITRRFGVTLSLSAVSRLLRDRLGMSPQRPLHRAAERSPEAIARWKRVEFPQIAAQAKACGAQIWFQDESGVRSDYHSGTTWAPVGRTPVVVSTGKRTSVNMISAVNARGGLHFRLVDGSVNADAFIDYLKALLHDTDSTIFLIVDGHPAHKAKKTQAFIASTGGRLRLFFLPGYAPDLNPDEWVWKNIKHDNVGKAAILNPRQLATLVENALNKLARAPHLIRAFFAHPELSYITAAQ